MFVQWEELIQTEDLEELQNMSPEIRLTDPRKWVREMDGEMLKDLCKRIRKTIEY